MNTSLRSVSRTVSPDSDQTPRGERAKVRSRTGLRFLLLQARDAQDPVRVEERASFARWLGCELEQVSVHGLLEGPPPEAVWRSADALLCGGSGEYYVSKGHLPQQASTLGFFRQVVKRGHPMFASCFGFHLVVEATGGELLHDPGAMEVGTFELTRTEAAAGDPLFRHLPERFWAQLGRKDRAAALPPGCSNLASSERCPLQAFRFPGKPIWASQFHPELDGQTNRARFERYIEGYSQLMSPAQIQGVLDSYRESRESSALLQHFVDLLCDPAEES